MRRGFRPIHCMSAIPVGRLTPSSGSWQVAHGPYTFDSVNNGWINHTVRFGIAANHGNVSGSKIRLTVQGNIGAGTLIWNLMYFGRNIGGPSGVDFDTTPPKVKVTWDGGSDGKTASGATQYVSDEIDFAYDHTQPHLLAVDFGATADALPYRNSTDGTLGEWGVVYKAAAAEAATDVVTGYTVPSGGLDRAWFIATLEVFA